MREFKINFQAEYYHAIVASNNLLTETEDGWFTTPIDAYFETSKQSGWLNIKLDKHGQPIAKWGLFDDGIFNYDDEPLDTLPEIDQGWQDIVPWLVDDLVKMIGSFLRQHYNYVANQKE